MPISDRIYRAPPSDLHERAIALVQERTDDLATAYEGLTTWHILERLRPPDGLPVLVHQDGASRLFVGSLQWGAGSKRLYWDNDHTGVGITPHPSDRWTFLPPAPKGE